MTKRMVCIHYINWHVDVLLASRNRNSYQYSYGYGYVLIQLWDNDWWLLTLLIAGSKTGAAEDEFISIVVALGDKI